MSKTEHVRRPIKEATLAINVAGHWYRQTVNSAVLAYACASSYIDSGVDYPGRYKTDRIVVKDRIMRSCIDVFDGKLESFANYGIQLDPVDCLAEHKEG